MWLVLCVCLSVASGRWVWDESGAFGEAGVFGHAGRGLALHAQAWHLGQCAASGKKGRGFVTSGAALQLHPNQEPGRVSRVHYHCCACPAQTPLPYSDSLCALCFPLPAPPMPSSPPRRTVPSHPPHPRPPIPPDDSLLPQPRRPSPYLPVGALTPRR